MISKIWPLAFLSLAMACGDKEEDTAEEAEEVEEVEEAEESEETEESDSGEAE